MGEPQTLREALDRDLIGMIRTSWPMDRSAEEKGWNEAVHACREKVRAALTERPRLVASPDSLRLDPPARCRIMIGAKRCEVHDARWYPEYAVRCDAAPQSSPDSLRLDPEDPESVPAACLALADRLGREFVSGGAPEALSVASILRHFARERKASALPDTAPEARP